MTFFLDTILGFLTLEGPGCHTVDNRSFSVAPPKFHEYDGSNGLCERSLASKLSAHCFDTFFSVQAKKFRYDTFIERSCEQLNIARRQQMNVEITAKIKRLICCDGHYPSTTRRTTFNYIDWIYHFS